jgi:hypothetical protein
MYISINFIFAYVGAVRVRAREIDGDVMFFFVVVEKVLGFAKG